MPWREMRPGTCWPVRKARRWSWLEPPWAASSAAGLFQAHLGTLLCPLPICKSGWSRVPSGPVGLSKAQKDGGIGKGGQNSLRRRPIRFPSPAKVWRKGGIWQEERGRGVRAAGTRHLCHLSLSVKKEAWGLPVSCKRILTSSPPLSSYQLLFGVKMFPIVRFPWANHAK